jgi:hypothetical protein
VATKRTISPLAQLINQMQGKLGSVSGYDPQLAASIQQALYQKSDLDRGHSSATNEAKIGYDELAQALQEQKVRGYETNEGNFSGNGLLRSGIFATEQGKVGEEYQKGIVGAAQRRQQMIQQATDARLSGYNQISSMLAGAQGSAAQRAADAAKQREMQAIQTQQQQALLGIQKQGLAQQQSLAEQQLQLYREQMARTGTGQSIPAPRPTATASRGPGSTTQASIDKLSLGSTMAGASGTYGQPTRTITRTGDKVTADSLRRRLGLPTP